MAARKRRPRWIVIAGPNGAGKTSARKHRPGVARVSHFVNADLIARGLSPLKPELAAIAAQIELVESKQEPPPPEGRRIRGSDRI
jgi:predicted ABC-type ATPase